MKYQHKFSSLSRSETKRLESCNSHSSLKFFHLLHKSIILKQGRNLPGNINSTWLLRHYINYVC
jgi:hypothetical protein